MTVATASRTGVPPTATAGGSRWLPRRLGRVPLDWALVGPTLFAIANAAAVLIVSPSVSDIWAALARESAVAHGVGLTYWFGWFGGAATPASYSVLSPYVSHLVGVKVLGALAAVACVPLAWLALRRSPRPALAVWVAGVLLGANLWSGRVPFLFGTAFAIGALVTLRARRSWWTLLLAVLTGLASPVPAAFLALAMVGVFIVQPSRRRSCLITLAGLGASLILVAIAFGTPGPQHFTFVEMLSCMLPFAAYLWTRPPAALKVVLWLGLFGSPLLFLIPNGLGSNFQRFAWYCLPPVVIAFSRRPVRLALLSLLPAVVFGTIQTTTDVAQGTSRSSDASYYAPLARQLDRIRPQLRDYRVEVVDDGSHTAAFALLDHAMLARGWETQEDSRLNSSLVAKQLDATTYKIWLQDNAVGYVAISGSHRMTDAEYRLVSGATPTYLQEIWADTDWTLYRVQNANPIVNKPVTVAQFSQAKLVLSVPCACTFAVRVHYSRYLKAATTPAGHGRAEPQPTAAQLKDDGFGWTTMTTVAPGRYTLSGSLKTGLFR